MFDSDNKFERVEEDSPFRCQAMAGSGQCLNRQVPGSEFCLAHGGRNARDKIAADKKRVYLLQRFQDDVHHHADHEQLKSLREEIAILRMLLQTTINKCKDETELMLKSSTIVMMLDKIEKLVRSCDRLELTSGSMLDATQAVQFVSDIVSIIGNHVKDSAVVNQIAEEIMEAYNEAKGEPHDVDS